MLEMSGQQEHQPAGLDMCYNLFLSPFLPLTHTKIGCLVERDRIRRCFCVLCDMALMATGTVIVRT